MASAAMAGLVFLLCLQAIAYARAPGLRVPNGRLDLGGPDLETYSVGASGPLHLGQLHDSPTLLVHPALPEHTVRIRRTDFCDPTVRSYAGYVDVSGARHIFFQYYESRRNPAEDDVVLWLSGGPGVSSTLGMLLELGPCVVEDANATRWNPYGWNDKANLLFVDQPVGVGYSYAEYGETVHSTAAAAQDIAQFLALLFNSLAELCGKALHIAGSSYGGRYVPWSAAEMLDLNRHLPQLGLVEVNLQSIMIGSGDTDHISVRLGMYDMQCTNASGMSPPQTIKNCVRMKQAVPRCENMFRASCLDTFDEMDCWAAASFCERELLAPWLASGGNLYDISKRCEGDIMDTMCYPLTKNITALMNQPWVRAALGVDEEVGNTTFILASTAVNAGFGPADHMQSALGYLEGVLRRGIRVLIYAGAYDLAGSWPGNEKLARQLEWEDQVEFASTEKTVWEVDGRRAGEVRQVGRLAFVTIDGAGHMAPYDKPKETLQMLNRWLSGEAF